MGISIPILGAPRVIGGGGIGWLELDRFLTDLTAGNVDGTNAEPGPGVRNTDETDGEFSTSSGVLNIPAQTTPVWGDLGLWYTPALTRAGGLMFTALLNVATWEEFGLCLHAAAAVVDPDSAEAAVQFNATDGQLDDETGEQIYNGLSTSTNYTLRLILRSTGHFIMLDNALIRIVRAGATATLYALLSNLDAVLTADNVGNVQLPIIDPLLFPIPTVSDTFSDTTPPLVSDGLAHVEANGDGAGVTWQGDGTFTNLGNKAYIDADAAIGADIITNGDFAADSDWDKGVGWTIPTPVASCDGSQVAVSLLTQAIGAGTFGRFFKVAFTVSGYSAGSLTSRTFGSFGTAQAADGTLTQVLRSPAGNTQIQMRANTTFVGNVDDVSVQFFTFKDVLRAVADNGQPYTAVAMTITDDTQAGVMINLDSVTNPQSGTRIWYDRVANSVYAQDLIAGVWQADSLAVAVTYGAGDLLEVRRIGNSVYVFYDGAYVGNFVASSSNANTLTALFATDNASYFEDFESFPATGYDYGAYA